MSVDDRPETAKRLRQARELAGFATARAASSRFGWKEDTYSQHERGLRGFARTAGSYAKAFKVSAAWLLTGEGVGPKSDQTVRDVAELSRLFQGLPDAQQRQLLENARLLHSAFGATLAPATGARGAARKKAS